MKILCDYVASYIHQVLTLNDKVGERVQQTTRDIQDLRNTFHGEQTRLTDHISEVDTAKQLFQKEILRLNKYVSTLEDMARKVVQKQEQNMNQQSMMIEQNTVEILQQKNSLIELKNELEQRYKQLQAEDIKLGERMNYHDEQVKQQEMKTREIYQKLSEHQAMLNNQAGDIFEIKQVTNTVPQELNKLFSEITTLEPRHHIQPNSSLLFVIDDFEENFRKSQKEQSFVYSDPFYCLRGYRALVCVLLNGWEDGSNSHISCYFEVLKGPFDDVLDWPMEFTAEFSIKGRNGAGLLRHSFDTRGITREDMEKHFGKPTKDANTVWGFSQFMRHDEISNYVENDEMKISINITPLKPSTMKTAVQINEHLSNLRALMIE